MKSGELVLPDHHCVKHLNPNHSCLLVCVAGANATLSKQAH